MGASNTDRTRQVDRTGGRTMTRYDALLLVIPAVFVLALAAAQVTGFQLSTVLSAASLVGALAVADGLFVNPPNDPGDR